MVVWVSTLGTGKETLGFGKVRDVHDQRVSLICKGNCDLDGVKLEWCWC